MKQLKATLATAEKQMNKALSRRDKRQDALAKAADRILQIEGPLELQKLVKKRRVEGIAVPFTVNLRKNCRFAKVVYPDTPAPFVSAKERFAAASQSLRQKVETHLMVMVRRSGVQ